MADLKEIAALLNVDLPIQETRSNPINNRAAGQKRRAWLLEDENDRLAPGKGVYSPLIEKGSINQVNQADSSNPFINPIDQPLKQKGVIKGVNKPLLLEFKDLRSNPLKLILFLFELAKLEKDKVTRRLTLREIQQTLNFSRDSARTALRFLLKNKLIERVNFKSGKTGWSQYIIKESLFREIEDALQKGSIAPINFGQVVINQKGSNSNSNIITTTNAIDPLAWETIDITPLEQIGLTRKHLLQLKKTSLEIIQESINHFAFGLKHNKKTQRYPEPLSVLMTVLKRGEAWLEQNYKSAQEIAIEEMLERKRAESERIKKLTEELLKLEFEEWLTKLNERTKNQIIEEVLGEKEKAIINTLPQNMQEKSLKKHLLDYFKREIKDKNFTFEINSQD